MSNGHRLGRRLAPDPRDQLFPASPAIPRSMMARIARAIRWSKRWTVGSKYVLNQGATSTCVACAWKHLLIAKPTQWRGSDPSTQSIYRWAVTHDEFSDNDLDEAMQFGTSVRAGAEYLVERAFIEEYRWAQTLQDIIEWIYSVGPVVVGTAWTEGMFTPNDAGIVTPTGPTVGGHAYLIRGHSKRTKQFRCLNSWGLEWGKGGDFFISEPDMLFLMTTGGEACCPVEKVRAV